MENHKKKSYSSDCAKIFGRLRHCVYLETEKIAGRELSQEEHDNIKSLLTNIEFVARNAVPYDLRAFRVKLQSGNLKSDVVEFMEQYDGRATKEHPTLYQEYVRWVAEIYKKNKK